MTMDVEVFLGGMTHDLAPEGPASRPGGLFYGRLRIGTMTPTQARSLYEELFVTGYGARDEWVMGGIEVNRFGVRVPGATRHANHGGCPHCTKRDDCHAWIHGDETLWEPHTRFYHDDEEPDSRWPWPHNWRMCEGSLTAWTHREVATHRAQAKAKRRGQELLDAFA